MFPLSTEILIVDDMKGIRVWLRKALESLGYTNIKEAGDGEEALNHLKANPAGLIFTDIVMPKKNGIELIKSLKADKNLANLPIIVLTAETDREMIVTAVSLGVESYIIKPATLPVLQKKMEEAFKKKVA